MCSFPREFHDLGGEDQILRVLRASCGRTMAPCLSPQTRFQKGKSIPGDLHANTHENESDHS